MHPIEILRVPYVLQLFFSDFWSTFSARNSNVFDQENFVFTFENKTIYILIIVKTEFSWTISGWKHAPKNPKKMLKSIRPIFLGLLVFLVAWTPPKNTSNTKKWNQVMSNQLENIIVQCTNFFTNFPVQNPSQHQHFFWDFYLVDVSLVNAAISNKTKWPCHHPRTYFFKSFRFFPMYWSSIIGKCIVPCEFQYFWKSEPP